MATKDGASAVQSGMRWALTIGFTIMFLTLSFTWQQKAPQQRGNNNAQDLAEENPREDPSSSVGFDLYIMAMFYLPESCFLYRHDDFEGCKNPRDEWKTQLGIHGLWPEYANGRWPQFCDKEKLSNSTVALLEPKLEKYWPDLKGNHHQELWEHEWSKHGTCTGLSQLTYFNEALEHAVATPDLIGRNYGMSVKRSELEEAFGSAALICSGRRWLSEVRVCLGLEKDGDSMTPTSRVPCPETVLRENSCTEESIRLTAFASDRKAD